MNRNMLTPFLLSSDSNAMSTPASQDAGFAKRTVGLHVSFSAGRGAARLRSEPGARLEESGSRTVAGSMRSPQPILFSLA